MSKSKANLELIERAIKDAGGLSKLALKANVSYQSVIDWRAGRKTPSPISCQKIEKPTGGDIKAKDILPDYPWEEVR
jgi:DNA-binding transcriptional regulator YdaS (Cro superfamily)